MALEGELTPILVQMVKSANTNGLLDGEGMTSRAQILYVIVSISCLALWLLAWQSGDLELYNYLNIVWLCDYLTSRAVNGLQKLTVLPCAASFQGRFFKVVVVAMALPSHKSRIASPRTVKCYWIAMNFR